MTKNILPKALVIHIAGIYISFIRLLRLTVQRTARSLFFLYFIVLELGSAIENPELYDWDIDVDLLLAQPQKSILTETDLQFINHSSPLGAYAYLGLMYELGEISGNHESNLSKALEIYTYLLKIYPNEPNVHLLKIAAARVYEKLNLHDNAINILSHEDTGILNMPSSYIILGDIYFKKGDIQSSVDYWKKSWKLNPFTGEINARINLCRKFGEGFINPNEYDINLLADSYNRWVFLKNEAYAHMLNRTIPESEDIYWIMYELMSDAYSRVPNAMLLLADFYKQGTHHFKANPTLAEKWLTNYKSITYNKIQLSSLALKGEPFYNVDISLLSLKEIKNMILWTKYPKQERGYDFPMGSSTDSYWKYTKLFLLNEPEVEYYSIDEDINLQVKLLSSDNEEAEQIIKNIDLEKCSLQTLYIMFDYFNDLRAAKIMLKRSCNTVTVEKMEIITESPGALIFSCLKYKVNDPIPSETEKVLNRINVGSPFHMMPDKLKSYWKKFKANYYLILEC